MVEWAYKFENVCIEVRGWRFNVYNVLVAAGLTTRLTNEAAA